MTVNSIILAMKMVQVTSEAKARPIMTALTSTSADLNIDQGDNSRSSAAAAFNSLPSRSAAVAGASEAGAATADGAGGAAGACDAAGACATAGADGAAGAIFCCADEGDASASIASAKIKPEVARKGDIYFGPVVDRSNCGVGIRSIAALAECRDK